MKNYIINRMILLSISIFLGSCNFSFSSGSAASIDEVSSDDITQLYLRFGRLETVLATGNTQPTPQDVLTGQHQAIDQAKSKQSGSPAGQSSKMPVNERTEESGEMNGIQPDAISHNQPRYLYLPDLSDGEQYVISMCPMNSSGDAYHMLAYIILAKSNGKDVPPVQLTYDSAAEEKASESEMNNYTAVCRTLNFSSMISLREHFSDPLYIDPCKNAETGVAYKKATYRPTVRQQNLIHTLKNIYTHFIDQKLLTSLIVQHCLQYGRSDTIRRLKDGFSVYDPANQHLQDVVTASNREYEKITEKTGTSPLVIIHARFASTANPEQDIEDGVLNLKNYLVQNGYFVWFFMADGRSQGWSFKQLKNENRTDPFPHNINGKDYGKFYHLRLLLKLTELPNVKIVGNTSGTLDLAAFLGHDVYNIHIWENSMNYQCARIIIQSTFLTLDLIKSDFLSQLEPTNNTWKLANWLSGEKQKIDTDTVRSAFTDPTHAGYRDLFCIQKLRSTELESIEYFEKIQSSLLELHNED